MKHTYRSAERGRLLRLRTEAFHNLWMLTGRIPRNPDPDELTHFPAAEIVKELNQWYFNDGGMYLTNACRSDYFALMEALEEVRKIKVFDYDAYLPLYKAASSLRHTLANELDARTSTHGRRI